MSENKVRYFRLDDDGLVCSTADNPDHTHDTSPDWTEVQVVPVDAIVIRREDVPKVHVVGGLVTAGEDENGDPYWCSAEANPNLPYWYGINALAVAEYLREHPPVDEEQVDDIAKALGEAQQNRPFPQQLSDRELREEARLLFRQGVRVEAKS